MSNKMKEPLDFRAAQMHIVRTRRDGLAASRRKIYRDDSGEVLTKQSFAEESNINNILKKYKATGVLPNSSRVALARFGDFGRVPSYKESLEMVIDAQEMFAELPSAVRNRFRNDPAELISFLGDSGNRDEAVKLGLLDASTGKPPLPSNELGERVSTQSKASDSTGGKTPPKAE